MITAKQLNQIEYDMKHGTAVVIDMRFISDVRALMAENLELYALLDKIKPIVSESIKLLNEVLK